MNKSIIPKLVNLLLIIVFISPLIYGLYQYDWDLNRFIGFRGAEVNVDLSYRVSRVYTDDSSVIFSLEIRNIGDLPINLLKLEASLNATLDMQVHFTSKTEYTFKDGYNIQPNDSVVVDLKFSITPIAGAKPYFTSIEYRLEVNSVAEIFDNPVSFPSVLEGGGPL